MRCRCAESTAGGTGDWYVLLGSVMNRLWEWHTIANMTECTLGVDNCLDAMGWICNLEARTWSRRQSDLPLWFITTGLSWHTSSSGYSMYLPVSNAPISGVEVRTCVRPWPHLRRVMSIGACHWGRPQYSLFIHITNSAMIMLHSLWVVCLLDFGQERLTVENST